MRAPHRPVLLVIALALLIGWLGSPHPLSGELLPAVAQQGLAAAPTRGAISLLLPLILKGADTGTPAPERRPWPATARGIHVFNDQLIQGMSDAQVTFCATHYAGTQKMIRSEADRLRAANPNLLILHYRLGHGLGYRAIEGACQPTGEWLGIVVGNDWVHEWPGDSMVQESWFSHYPAGSLQRVLNCDWGWYLMAIDDAGWRSAWQRAVLEQMQANDADGVFMDSLSVPNYLGGDRYSPALPALDPAYESAWAQRIEDWLAWLQTQPLGGYYLVPNAGSWITTRDPTLWLAADGLMIEGFALEADASPYAIEDWRLQMDRVLGATKRGQALILQNYAIGEQERMFTLGCYLLVKGGRSYLNIDNGEDPEWWPEYDLPIGEPLEPVPALVDDLAIEGSCVYGRRFDNALVLVNATNPWEESGTTCTLGLSSTHYLAETEGDGYLPESGVPTGAVSYRAVSEVTLAPYTAVVLFTERP